ncbi:hypothetical protein Tco_1274160 [Tanacetum coccineum]
MKTALFVINSLRGTGLAMEEDPINFSLDRHMLNPFLNEIPTSHAFFRPDTWEMEHWVWMVVCVVASSALENAVTPPKSGSSGMVTMGVLHQSTTIKI